MGAIVIERHITLDREMEGPDHAARFEPEEFKALVSGIREVEAARGDRLAERALKPGRAHQPREPRQEPRGRPQSSGRHGRRRGRRRREEPGPGPVAAQDAGADRQASQPRNGQGRLLLPERPRQTLPRWRAATGSTALGACRSATTTRNVFWKSASQTSSSFTSVTATWSAIRLPTCPVPMISRFVVHAPELFAGSKLMDLATPDEDLRRYSLEQTQAVIDITRGAEEVLSRRPRARRSSPISAASPWTTPPVAGRRRRSCYRRFSASLCRLDMTGVEPIPQTMAPFPWHFGGQRYQQPLHLPGRDRRLLRQA